MAPAPIKPPARSYDEIVRRTVPEPDTSFRPTPEQLRDGRAGIRAQDADERELEARVVAAIGDVPGVRVEVEHGRVVLSGRVGDAAALRALEDRVSAIEGARIENRVVVSA